MRNFWIRELLEALQLFAGFGLFMLAQLGGILFPPLSLLFFGMEDWSEWRFIREIINENLQIHLYLVVTLTLLATLYVIVTDTTLAFTPTIAWIVFTWTLSVLVTFVTANVLIPLTVWLRQHKRIRII